MATCAMPAIGLPAHANGFPSPVHVMHVVHRFGVGGMEVGITKLVNALDRARVVSSIASCCPADGLKKRLRPDIPLYEFNRRRGNDPVLVAQFYRLLRRERPHVLHTHRWATLCEGLVAARLAGVPIVVHGEHGTLEIRRRNASIQRWMWNRVDQLLSVSSRLGERMSSEIGFPLDRIRVIRNGVDLDRFRPVHRAAARNMFGLRPEDLVVGTVGRLVPVKDHATLLRALALVRSSGLAFSALVAGAGPLMSDLASLAAALDLADVRFLGNRDDVERVLGAFDVFVLSSESEGLSNTIQEAMATALPVVATDVGGAGELVERDRTGLLVPPRSPRALADAIMSLLRDPPLRARMGVAGRERAEALFALDRMVREYERLYLELATVNTRLVSLARTHEA
ncbi:MAG: glycosyltransferase [Acidobacteriota bacterium]